MPVEVVGRPSRGEGRIPGVDVGGEGLVCGGGEIGELRSTALLLVGGVGVRAGEEEEERPRLRLRKDMVLWSIGDGNGYEEL